MKVQYELGDNVYWDDPKNNPSPESIAITQGHRSPLCD